MGKAGLAFIVSMLAVASAFGQILPKPLPEDNPHAWDDANKQYPSAKVCGQCHQKQYEQWQISSHAYANLSPMFNKFEQTINDLSSGTVNYFCVRCHASVGTALGEKRSIAWWDRAPASREGITCISCHRAGEGYGKFNGARRITPGDISEAVHGPFDTTGVLKAITNAATVGILVSPDEADKPDFLRIHQQAVRSEIIVKSEFCVTCHQVQVHPGIKLETVWEEYRNSPARKEGITCQQCHMSKSPGQNVGFDTGYAAIVNGRTFGERPLTDHRFIGPGYPISHPGLFPIDNDSRFTPQQWLKFNYRKKWGSDEFENDIPPGYSFPDEWKNAADRKEAWKVVTANLQQWEERKKLRETLLENGSRLDGPYFDGPVQAGKPLKFTYKLTNLNKGHNLPSGSLGAQPELWIDVALLGPDSDVPVWESGYVDSYGDVADVESRDVRDRKIPFDDQLVNMQAKFITTNLKGTDREMYLPINLDGDQLPFIRPGGAPTSILNHPPNARMEKHSIPPLGTRAAHYSVPADRITKPGTYRLAIRLRGRTEPIYFMDFVKATTDMKRSENEWVTDTHRSAVAFEVGGGTTPEVRKLTDDPVEKQWFGKEARYDDKDYDWKEQTDIYGAKYLNKTAVPPVELGMRLYDRGAYTPRPTYLGRTNPVAFSFLSYGDLRVAAASYDNGGPPVNGKTRQSQVAARLNLDMDLALTATERFHAFTRPLDKGGQFTSFQIDGPVKDKFTHHLDLNLDTLFFEGDLGSIVGGLRNQAPPYDLPIAVGRIPFLTQNGVWIEDAFNGAAATIAARNSPKYGISNTDLTFFVALDKLTTDADPGDKTKALGLAGFADMWAGYVEYGYAFVKADKNDLSYNNVTAAFSRRYNYGRHIHLANSVRVIGNFGQNGIAGTKTADGVLLLVENEIIPRYTPYGSKFNILNYVPYVNFFAGFNSPQSLARNGDAGGVLRNTGINFESDGLTRYPTLDAKAHDTYGGAAGIEYLFPDLHRQIVFEGAVVEGMRGNDAEKQYAIGARYQHPLNNQWILRLDAMHGWRRDQKDVYGARIELRCKF